MADVTDGLKMIVGDTHVLAGSQDRSAFENDWTGAWHGTSAAVVRPDTTEKVAAVMALAFETGTPVIPQGGNTGLSGGTYAPEGSGAILLNLGRMNRVRDVSVSSRTASVDAGVVLEALNADLAAHGLTFPLSFGAKGSAMIGGMLSTNAGGSNAVRYGTARTNCLGIELVTADGRIMNLMNALKKDNTGYDLRDLVIGAEGTLGVITGAVLRLVAIPPVFATAYAALSDLSVALDILNTLQDQTGGTVEAFEYLPPQYFDRVRAHRPELTLPLSLPGPANLMIEIAGRAGQTQGEIDEILETVLGGAMEAGHVTDAALAQTGAQRQNMWKIREIAAEITYGLQATKDHDIALPLDRVATFLERGRAIAERYAPPEAICPLGHLGDGNIHFPVWIDPHAAETKQMTAELEGLATELGGTFSAEHGVGLIKLASMKRAKDPAALAAMRAVKDALDPKGIMNPGKVLP